MDELSPEELEGMVDLYDEYKINFAYKKDDIFKYQGKLYKVIKGLTSQENWKPGETPSEYLPLMPDGVIPEWVQPTGAHDSYSIGDNVSHNDKHWISTHDNNTWEPGVYGWEEVKNGL